MRRRRSIAGPIMLITIGVLFAVDYIWGRWSFWRETWPVVLIVFGLVRLVEHMALDDHYYQQGSWQGGPPPPSAPGSFPPPPPPPADYPSYPVYPPPSS